MKYVVFPRVVMMASTPPEKKWALISICEEGNFPEVYSNEFMEGRLNLQFHDSDGPKLPDDYEWDYPGAPYPPPGIEEEMILFNEDHAKQVLDFYDNMVERGVEVLYVHCLMGQCRSAAVAASLSKVFSGDDSQFFRGQFRPNMLVYRGIMNEAVDRKLL